MTPIETLMQTVDWQETGDPEHVVMADGGIPWATHSGILEISGLQLRVYRLSTGEAIIDANDMEEFFGGIIIA